MGSLELTGNHRLKSLGGLESIRSVGWSIEIENNDGLIDLTGLDQLATVEDTLYVTISDNDALTELRGLMLPTDVPVRLSIRKNSNLTDIQQLLSIDQIASLSINENEHLTTLDGLANLNTIQSQLTISGNTRLRNLDGLSSINAPIETVWINDNPSLTSIVGLSNSTQIEFLLIDNNSSLACCDICILIDTVTYDTLSVDRNLQDDCCVNAILDCP